MSVKKLFIRLATSDIVLNKEDANRIPKYITISDKNGGYLTELEVYSVGYEDEDGNECDEDGN